MKKAFIIISTICVTLIFFVLVVNIYSIFNYKQGVSDQVKNNPDNNKALVVDQEEATPIVITPPALTPEPQVINPSYMPPIPRGDNNEPSFKTPKNANPNDFYIQNIE